MNEQQDSPASEGIPERIKVVIRAATTDDWIGVAYCKDYAGDPSTIHEFVNVPSLDEAAVRRAAEKIEDRWITVQKNEGESHREAYLRTVADVAEIISTELASRKVITTPLTDRAEQNTSGEMQNKASSYSQIVIPKDNAESADLTGKTMSAYPYVFTNEDGIIIYRAEFLVCDPCVKLEGQMCRTPECVFCFQDVRVARAVLNKTLNCPIVDGERLILLPHTQDTKSGASPALSVDTVESSVPHQTESNGSDASGYVRGLRIAARICNDIASHRRAQSLLYKTSAPGRYARLDNEAHGASDSAEAIRALISQHSPQNQESEHDDQS